MHVSIHLSEQSRGPFEDLAIIESVISQAKRADRAGFASVSLTEHHFAGFNTYSDPFLLGSHLAGQLKQTHLAITVVQMALQHPIRVAEYCNILDLLMRGRLMVALAAGSASAVELGAFGVSIEDRPAMTTQRIASMLKAWAREEEDPPTDISTDFDRGLLHGRIMPTSYRRPRPLLGRASATEATIIETARLGWPLVLGSTPRADLEANIRVVKLYKETLESSGHNPETVRECLSWLGFMSFVCLAPTERAARARFEEYQEIGGTGPTPGKEGVPLAVANEWTNRQLYRARDCFVGSPEMVVEHLRAFSDIGVDHVRLAPIITSGKREESDAAFELFIAEVLPHLDPELLSGPVEVFPTCASAPAG